MRLKLQKAARQTGKPGEADKLTYALEDYHGRAGRHCRRNFDIRISTTDEPLSGKELKWLVV